jgi:hypothetical protein
MNPDRAVKGNRTARLQLNPDSSTIIPDSPPRQACEQPQHGDPVGRKSRTKVPKASPLELPLFCDYSCTHASFAPDDAIGACRKELAVYCTLLEQFNNKNSRCIAREGSHGVARLHRG